MLKFKPGTGRPTVDRTKLSRPMVNRDSAFFWEGTAAGELRIQKCNACGELRTRRARSVRPATRWIAGTSCLRPWHGALVPGASRTRRTRQAAAPDRGADRSP